MYVTGQESLKEKASKWALITFAAAAAVGTVLSGAVRYVAVDKATLAGATAQSLEDTTQVAYFEDEATKQEGLASKGKLGEIGNLVLTIGFGFGALKKISKQDMTNNLQSQVNQELAE